ncbi:hypothetical protein ACLBTQ_35425, partial [Pseudomonas aeruginosa]
AGAFESGVAHCCYVTCSVAHQRYTQLGFELGHWLDRRNSLMFGLSRNVATDNAFHGSQALLRLVHVF